MRVRMTWMDLLRGLAILLVVVFHSTSLLRHGYEAPALVTALNSLFSPYRMHILAFLSGFLMYISGGKSTRQFVSGKLRNLAWPYAVWTIICAYTVGRQYSVTDHEFYISYLWYLLYLLTFYFVARILKDVPRIPLILTSISVAAVIPDEYEAPQRYFYLLAVFLLGEVAQSSLAKWQKLMSTKWVFVLLFAVGAASLTAATSDEIIRYDVRWFAASMSGVILACFFAIRAADLAMGTWLQTCVRAIEFIGRNSVVYYVTHFPVIFGVVLLCADFNVKSPILVMSIAVISALVVGTLLTILRERIPWVDLLFAFPRFRARRTTGPLVGTTAND